MEERRERVTNIEEARKTVINKVLELKSKGLTNLEITKELEIPESTIRFILKNSESET
jgi:orotate phosphoribosyltransferase-like protein